MKKKALISACLMGVNCKYSGGNNLLPAEKLKKLMDEYELIPVCPECYGGLTTPRVPSERRDGGVYSKLGVDVTAEFAKGAEAALYLAKLLGAELAVLKENSPSCGSGTIYDGTFSGSLTAGDGVTAELLKENEILIIGESQI
mgnify:CR=1 FL=1